MCLGVNKHALREHNMNSKMLIIFDSSVGFSIPWISVVVVPLVDLGVSKTKLLGQLNSKLKSPVRILGIFLF